jgi:hypothetical protein
MKLEVNGVLPALGISFGASRTHIRSLRRTLHLAHPFTLKICLPSSTLMFQTMTTFFFIIERAIKAAAFSTVHHISLKSANFADL